MHNAKSCYFCIQEKRTKDRIDNLPIVAYNKIMERVP